MNALILAGGEGTRLRPLTISTPKPIVPIGNQPFLVHQILALKKAGITEITLSLNYQPTKIVEIIGDGSRYGVNFNYVVESNPMGTAGAYKFAENYLRDTTLVLNGDVLTDIDLRQVINHHQSLKAEATIVLTPVENPTAYGLVEFGKDFAIKRFLEKPSFEEVKQLGLNTINAGIYILESTVLNLIPQGEKYSFEYQLFPALLEKKSRFFAFAAAQNYWIDIGTPQRYLQANMDILEGKCRTFTEEKFFIAKSSVINRNSRINRSLIGENVSVGMDAVVENSVIWAGAKIGANAKVINSVIGYETEVKENEVLENLMVSDKVMASTN